MIIPHHPRRESNNLRGTKKIPGATKHTSPHVPPKYMHPVCRCQAFFCHRRKKVPQRFHLHNSLFPYLTHFFLIYYKHNRVPEAHSPTLTSRKKNDPTARRCPFSPPCSSPVPASAGASSHRLCSSGRLPGCRAGCPAYEGGWMPAFPRPRQAQRQPGPTHHRRSGILPDIFQ